MNFGASNTTVTINGLIKGVTFSNIMVTTVTGPQNIAIGTQYWISQGVPVALCLYNTWLVELKHAIIIVFVFLQIPW